VQSIRYVGTAKAGMGAFRLGEKQLGWKGGDGSQHQWEGKDLQSAEWHSSRGLEYRLLKLRFQPKEIIRFATLAKSRSTLKVASR